jgi:subtilisin family serine protease
MSFANEIDHKMLRRSLDCVGLIPLMERTSGRPEIVIALIDGPIFMENPAMWSPNVQQFGDDLPARCAHPSSSACLHGTSVGSILAAKRGFGAPAICPGCTLLVRAIFPESKQNNGQIPTASPSDLAEAIVDGVNAGASVVNLSVGIAQPSAASHKQLDQALHYAATRDVLVVFAVGNEGKVGGSVLTNHPWGVPVIAWGASGGPVASSNLSASIGHRGLSAPGENVPVIGSDSQIYTITGTSAAAPFVSGTAALLKSEFPRARAAAIKIALTSRDTRRRPTLVPALLDAQTAYHFLARAT